MKLYLKHNMFSGKRIAFAIVDQMNVKRRHEKLYQKMLDVTWFYTKRLACLFDDESKKNTSDRCLKCVVVYHDTVDNALHALQDYDIVIVQSVGNMIQHNDFLELVDEYINNNPDFFYVGFTLDWQEDRWIELHHQMVVFNEQKWIELGKPQWGDWQTVTEELPNYSRSPENFHDHYTPYWIKGEPGTTVGQRKQQGWGMIKCALENGIKIDNFSQEMRNCRLFLYPESDSVKFYEGIVNGTITDPTINPNQKRWLKTFQFKEQVWVYNSEAYEFPTQLTKNIDTYIGPAAGFKYLDVLNYNDNVKFVIYDFMDISIQWIKMLRAEWDGRNYPVFLRNNYEWENYYKYIDDNIEYNQQILMNQYGTEDNFVKLWDKFKLSDIEYIKCDLFNVDDIQMLKEKVSGNTLFYYSNIFATDFQIKRLSLTEISESYDRINHAFDRPGVMTYGTDSLGTWTIKQGK